MANLEISLKWNGYQNNILSNVKELFRDQCLSDVTLVSEGQSFKAHKVILSACSSVFRTIFQQNPHKDPIIVLHDINTASLWTLLTFMYNGEVSVTEEFLPVLLKTAESLSVYGLSTGAEKTAPEDVKIRVPEKQLAKKRKKTDLENNNNNNKCKKIPPILEKPDVLPAIESQDLPKNAPIIPKEEPVDSPLTDYSASSESADIDIRLFIDEKPSFSPENNPAKCVSRSSGRSVKKCINEVSSTQPCLNTVDEKSSNDFVNEQHKDNVEIDKEVENVLQSGTIVESLNVASENFNAVSNEPNSCKEKCNTYANPSFPCPFCPRVYNSWGYRRRHVKSQHMTNRLSCKWCVEILPSTGAWYNHSTREHGIPHEEARNSLVVMVEAHAVLTLNEPSVAQLLGQVGIKEGKNGGEQNN